MGFGCNAVGVTGCRIIDSPRERLIAMITNSFVPCNGRFPALIAIISMFFVGTSVSSSGIWSALILTGVIILGIAITLIVSRILSATILKGVPSSFILELPPYRKPQIGHVIISSIKDRIIFVLGRAVCVAAPAGLVIWLLANIHIDGSSLLSYMAGFLDPFAHIIGLDGVILLAFILGFPANEIVLPLIVMGYMATGSIQELGSLTQIRELFIANGWTTMTAVCTILFMLIHWPCSTTLLTVKKESGSAKWAFAAFAVPAVCGITICFLVASIFRIFGT